MEKFINKIPNWIINLISFISGILTIVAAISNLFSSNFELKFITIILCLCGFMLCLIIRIRKFKKIMFISYELTSFNYHKLTHNARDLYFEIMRMHKENNLTKSALNKIYKSKLTEILDYLCNIMEIFCDSKINACIKLITSPEEDNKFINKITLSTFCRSSKSDTTRGAYETTNTIIKLCDNTDFTDIVDPINGLNVPHFYKRNLKIYDEELIKQGKNYRNSNNNWKHDYIGTIVVPIQIEHKNLYSSNQEDSSHVLGFLCVDSLSSSAFLERYENFNTDYLKSFADLIYILLGQYKHYLSLIYPEN